MISCLYPMVKNNKAELWDDSTKFFVGIVDW